MNNNDYKEKCWKRYLENQKYEKYDKEDLVDEIIELEQENQQLKKQKVDVVEYIKSLRIYGLRSGKMLVTKILNKILRMLGEKDE